MVEQEQSDRRKHSKLEQVQIGSSTNLQQDKNLATNADHALRTHTRLQSTARDTEFNP
jgi:hypothetical protein